MIRPNNGMLIAVITLVITLQLAMLGEWKNIGQNALALIAGVLLPVVPFVVYFALRGALAEFIYATWTFNLIYAQSLEFLLDWQKVDETTGMQISFLDALSMQTLYRQSIAA